MTRLRCYNISKSFDGVLALSQVSMEMNAGEVTAIIGPNGAGKTTLFNVFTGVLRPDAGKCLLGNKDLSGLRPCQVAQAGLVRTFQNLRLIRNVSVLENLMLAQPNQSGEDIVRVVLRHHLASEERKCLAMSMEILNLLGLSAKAMSPCGTLSYGEQKLVTLGCCLATRASFLLLDEPLAGVHPELCAKILDLLKVIAHEGRGVVFIEHDLDAVRGSADKVVVMSNGSVIAAGFPTDVLKQQDVLEAYLA